MADIFLSYANEDRESARALAGVLESAGWTVWWDRRIPAGRTWRSMIEEALKEMHGMVVLWSTNSVESDWVKEEAEEARALGKLIPVLRGAKWAASPCVRAARTLLRRFDQVSCANLLRCVGCRRGSSSRPKCAIDFRCLAYRWPKRTFGRDA